MPSIYEYISYLEDDQVQNTINWNLSKRQYHTLPGWFFCWGLTLSCRHWAGHWYTCAESSNWFDVWAEPVGTADMRQRWTDWFLRLIEQPVSLDWRRWVSFVALDTHPQPQGPVHTASPITNQSNHWNKTKQDISQICHVFSTECKEYIMFTIKF